MLFLLSPEAFGEEEFLDVLLQFFDPSKVFVRRKLWMFFKLFTVRPLVNSDIFSGFSNPVGPS